MKEVKSYKLTHARLKELLSYNPKTGLFVWIKNPKFHNIIGKVAGTLYKTGYIKIKVDGEIHFAHRLAWLYVTGKYYTDAMDHANGIKSDNRFVNLREATISQNKNNIKKITNKLGVRGVSYCSLHKKYRAIINPHRQPREHLGYFDTIVEASEAWDKRAKELHGKFYYKAGESS